MSGHNRLQEVAAAARRVLLGAWVGSVAFFSFAVAPTLFRVVRTAPADRASPAPNALAGDVVVTLLQRVAWLGLAVALIILVLQAADTDRRWRSVRMGGVLVAVGCVLGSMLWLTPTMLDLLAQMNGPVDALPETNPVRVAFNGLHGLSSALHLGMMVGPLAALVLDGWGAHSTR